MNNDYKDVPSDVLEFLDKEASGKVGEQRKRRIDIRAELRCREFGIRPGDKTVIAGIEYECVDFDIAGPNLKNPLDGHVRRASWYLEFRSGESLSPFEWIDVNAHICDHCGSRINKPDEDPNEDYSGD